jgi:uncharacterized membrane protein YidH (DUF202 family)
MGFLPVALAQEASDAAAGAIVGGFVIFWIIIVIAAIIGLALWIWALIDVIRREFPEENDKTIWLVVLIVSFVVGLSLIGAIVYLIVGRKKGTLPGQPSEPTPPPVEPSK